VLEAITEALPEGFGVQPGPFPLTMTTLALGRLSGELIFVGAVLRPGGRASLAAAATAAMRRARAGVVEDGHRPWPPGTEGAARVTAVAEVRDGMLHMSYRADGRPVLQLRPIPLDRG
jgi:hypothetical protein